MQEYTALHAEPSPLVFALPLYAELISLLRLGRAVCCSHVTPRIIFANCVASCKRLYLSVNVVVPTQARLLFVYVTHLCRVRYIWVFIYYHVICSWHLMGATDCMYMPYYLGTLYGCMCNRRPTDL